MDNNYTQNRANLIKQLKDAKYIVIGGNGLISRSSDTNYSFRQDSNLLYLTGLDEPSLSLFIDVQLNKTYLVLPNQTKTQAIFDGSPDTQELLNKSNCNEVINYTQLAIMLKNKCIYFNMPAKNNLNGLYTNPHRRWLKNYLKYYNVTFKDARPAMANLRMIKQPYEIDNITKAVSITKKILNSISQNLWLDNFTEQQIAWQITADFAKHNVAHGYQPIVAKNPNSATLHHQPTSQSISKSSSVLIDVGAEYNHYSADISRTICKSQDSIYQDITLAQQQIIKFLKPGLLFKDIQQYAKDLLINIALKHNIDEPIDVLFPHAIGHHLGLDVHDVADYTKPLIAGMVITIEPGIYSHKYKLGYRIEDDVLITSTGAKVL
jgi:Xaa-Pro aminopeptidase